MRVLEIASGPASSFAGMLLSALGAEVLRIEPPRGTTFTTQATETVDGPSAAYLHRGKNVARVDLAEPEGADAFLQLAKQFGAVVEDLGPGGLESLGITPQRISVANDRAVVVRVSPFGLTGPRAGWASSDLVVQAMGGILQSTGFDDSGPLGLPTNIAHFIGGLHAATAALAGGFGAKSGTEDGAVVEVSLEEAYMQHWSRHIAQWAYSGHGIRREERGPGRQAFRHTAMAEDGWIYVLALFAEWEALAAFFGLDQYVTDEWASADARADRWSEIAVDFDASVASRERYDWFAHAAEQGYTFAPVHSVLDLLDSPQYVARGFFGNVEYEGVSVRVPGLPFTWDGVGGARSNALPTSKTLISAGIAEATVAALQRSGIIDA